MTLDVVGARLACCSRALSRCAAQVALIPTSACMEASIAASWLWLTRPAQPSGTTFVGLGSAYCAVGVQGLRC